MDTRGRSRDLSLGAQDARSWNLWARRADAAGEAERIATGDEAQWPLDVSPDGRWLLFRRGTSATLFKLSLDDREDVATVFPGERQLRKDPSALVLDATFSPDGKWVAYDSDESGRPEIYVRPFPGGERRWQVSTDGGWGSVWSRSGEIFYIAGGRLQTVAVTRRGEDLTFGKPEALFPIGGDSGLGPSYDVTADGQTVVTVRSATRRYISLIFNWPRELQRVVSRE